MAMAGRLTENDPEPEQQQNNEYFFDASVVTDLGIRSSIHSAEDLAGQTVPEPVFDQVSTVGSPQALSTGASPAAKGIQMVEVKSRPFPMPNKKLCPVKIPKCLLQFEVEPFNVVEERQKISDNLSTIQQLETEGVVRWRIGSTHDNTVEGTMQQDTEAPVGRHPAPGKPNSMQVESNSSLVQWSDGTWTIAVGDTHYECQLQSDRCFIVETSNPNCYIAQGITAEKMTLRPFGPTTSQLVSGVKGTSSLAKNTMQLTSAADALRSEIANRRHLEAAREQHGPWARPRANRIHK